MPIAVGMIDCDMLIDRFHAEARNHVHLAMIAQTAPVAAMHVELAELGEWRARAFGALCDDDRYGGRDAHGRCVQSIGAPG